jgi:hypothetical protein
VADGGEGADADGPALDAVGGQAGSAPGTSGAAKRLLELVDAAVRYLESLDVRYE